MSDKSRIYALRSKQYSPEIKTRNLLVRQAVPEDALSIHKLVDFSPPLDPNSLYCNLLQCSHFAGTSVVVEHDGRVVAFMTGYIKPDSRDVLFVWQMAVAKEFRGIGLPGAMLSELMDRHSPRFVETTVTENNKKSAAVFERFASEHAANLSTSILFDRDQHFEGRHDSEILYRIGPIFR